jgi:hypothetical protein
MANKKPSTGNPELGKAEKKAKKIKEQIHASCGVSDDVNIYDDFEGDIDISGGEGNKAEAVDTTTNEHEETEKTATLVILLLQLTMLELLELMVLQSRKKLFP